MKKVYVVPKIECIRINPCDMLILTDSTGVVLPDDELEDEE